MQKAARKFYQEVIMNLRDYYTFGLSLLQLMSIIAVASLGIVAIYEFWIV